MERILPNQWYTLEEAFGKDLIAYLDNPVWNPGLEPAEELLGAILSLSPKSRFKEGELSWDVQDIHFSLDDLTKDEEGNPIHFFNRKPEYRDVQGMREVDLDAFKSPLRKERGQKHTPLVGRYHTLKFLMVNAANGDWGKPTKYAFGGKEYPAHEYRYALILKDRKKRFTSECVVTFGDENIPLGYFEVWTSPQVQTPRELVAHITADELASAQMMLKAKF